MAERTAGGLLLALIATTLFAASQVSPGPKANRAVWLDDVAAAQAESRRTGKPIFAVLH